MSILGRSKAQRHEQKLREAAANGDEVALRDLGSLLYGRGDLHGAEAVFRCLADLGLVDGHFNLGVVLRELGDLEGAVVAFRRADSLGDGNAAALVGDALRKSGDFEEAAAAYRRAEERGYVEGAFLLGMMLWSQGDADGAEEALCRAAGQGLVKAARALGDLRFERGDREGAEDAWILASPRSGLLPPEEARRWAEAHTDVVAGRKAVESLDAREAELRSSDRAGNASAAFKLGWLLFERDSDVAGAYACYCRAIQRGDPRAAAKARHLEVNYGDRLHK
jgi:tetratricopeptide (TPR) repeat protein